MHKPSREEILAGDSRRLDDDDDDEPLESQSQRVDPGIDKHLLDARTVLVHGPITDKLAAYVAARVMVIEAKDPEKPITVMINSPGGSADSGFAIYDMLRFVRPQVHTVVNGLCASAGILVLLGGDEGCRFSTPESRFMIHQPSTTGMGTASDLDITAREVLKLRERYIGIIAEACGRDAERILEDVRRDYWLNATEAKDYGLIAKVVTNHRDLPK